MVLYVTCKVHDEVECRESVLKPYTVILILFAEWTKFDLLLAEVAQFIVRL